MSPCSKARMETWLASETRPARRRGAGRMLDRAGTESWQVGRGSGWRSRRYGLRAGRAELSRDK